jgi:hypothetical protein
MAKTRIRSHKRVFPWFASRRPQTPAEAGLEASLEIQRPQGAGRPCYEAGNSACRGEWRREAGSQCAPVSLPGEWFIPLNGDYLDRHFRGRNVGLLTSTDAGGWVRIGAQSPCRYRPSTAAHGIALLSAPNRAGCRCYSSGRVTARRQS